MSSGLNVTDWKARLETTEAAIWALVDSMAADLRAQVILPLCCQHRLTFISGNGSWWFTRVDALRRAESRRTRITYMEATHWSFHDEEDAIKHGLDLGDAWELLSMEPLHACPIAYRIEEVTEADWEVKA